jgi:predicted RNase H-like HicB family nuclease
MRKKPDRYIYPAIFSYDDDGVAVSFPDFPGCNTCGKDQDEAVYMAKDALAGHLSCMEDDNDPIPEPSDLRSIHAGDGEAIVLVEAWMIPLRKKPCAKTSPFRRAWRTERKRPESISRSFYPRRWKKNSFDHKKRGDQCPLVSPYAHAALFGDFTEELLIYNPCRAERQTIGGQVAGVSPRKGGESMIERIKELVFALTTLIQALAELIRLFNRMLNR